MDNIIIYGTTPQEHDRRLEAAMKVVKEVGLKLQTGAMEPGALGAKAPHFLNER